MADEVPMLHTTLAANSSHRKCIRMHSGDKESRIVVRTMRKIPHSQEQIYAYLPAPVTMLIFALQNIHYTSNHIRFA